MSHIFTSCYIKVFYQYLAESQHMSNNPIQHFKLPRDISEIGQQRYEIDKINLLFQHDPQSTLKGYQQRLLLEFITVWDYHSLKL